MDVDKLMQALADNTHPQRVLRIIKTAAPAAGAKTVTTVPGGSIWRPISFIAAFTTSVAVANRQPWLEITDGTDVLAISLTPAIIAAGTASRLCFFGAGQTAEGGASVLNYSSPMPDFVLPGGFTIGLNGNALDAADQFGASVLWVEEYLALPFPQDIIVREGLRERMLEGSAANEGSM